MIDVHLNWLNWFHFHMISAFIFSLTSASSTLKKASKLGVVTFCSRYSRYSVLLRTKTASTYPNKCNIMKHFSDKKCLFLLFVASGRSNITKCNKIFHCVLTYRLAVLFLLRTEVRLILNFFTSCTYIILDLAILFIETSIEWVKHLMSGVIKSRGTTKIFTWNCLYIHWLLYILVHL